MLSLAAAWVLFPLVLLAVAAGLGLLFDRVIGRYLPGALVLPIGTAAAIVLVRLVTSTDATSELALPLLIVLTIAGFAVGRERVAAIWAERHALLAAAAVFLVVGAPAYMSLEPTFLGYLQLPDTSHQLSIAAFQPEGGTEWEKLDDSAFRLVLKKYIGTEYPIAPQATVGVLAPLSGGLDPAWVYHPFLAFLLAMAALSVYALAAPVRSNLLRAGVAFAGAAPALVYSYALQGSIKEVAGLSMFLAAVAATADLIAARRPAHGLFAVLVPAVAMFGSLGPASAPYLGPVLLVATAVVVARAVRTRGRRELVAVALVAIAALALAGPALSGIERAYNINTATLDEGGGADKKPDLGNLAAPLKTEQALGVWFNGDYRWVPQTDRARSAQDVAELVLILAALAGLAWALWRRAWGPLLLVLGLTPATFVLLERGSPYADAKVLMLASPLALVFALLAAGWLWEWKRFAGYAAAVVTLGALLFSQALAYHDSHPAPYERLDELLEVNDRLSDSNATLVTEYDEFEQYFTRDTTPYAQPETPHEYRTDRHRNPSGLSDPNHRPSLKTPIDIDDLTSDYVQSFDAIVLRRSPTMSLPPANFERTYRGDYYEVWERGADRVVAHLPLGRNVFEPSGVPRCRDVRALAEQARAQGGTLVAPARPAMPTFVPTGAPPSAHWIPYPLYPGAVVLDGAGSIGPALTFPEGGRYRIWLEGSFGRPVSAVVDEERIGTVEYELGNPGQYLTVGEVTVGEGDQPLRIEQAGGDLRPGNGGALAGLRHLGPVVFSPPENEEPEVLRREPGEWRSLCGERLDWVEVALPAA